MPKKQRQRKPEPKSVVIVVGQPDPYRLTAVRLMLLGHPPCEARALAEGARRRDAARAAGLTESVMSEKQS